MDIYSFLNSFDVAEHCRTIGKTWTSFEMAVIIGRSNRPMSDKHIAWRELIADYPDMPTQKNMHYESYDSLHKKLAELVDYEERAIQLLYKQESGAVYKYKIYRCSEYVYSDTIFSCMDLALSDIKDSWERDEVERITIEKTFIDDIDCDKGRIDADVDYDGKLFSISTGRGADSFPDIDFDNLIWDIGELFYIEIPVPFKYGDILLFRHVWEKQDTANIFVLDSLDNDDPKKQERRLRGEMSDGSDLLGSGFFVDDSGLLCWGHAGMYDSYEYFRGKLEGKNRMLHYASLFMRNHPPQQIPSEIGLSELLTMQCRIILKHRLDNDLPTQSHGCFILEPHRAENRFAYGEKEHIEKTGGLMPWVAKKLSKYQVEFLVKETGSSMESIQTILGHPGGGYLMRECAGICHDENHFERIRDNRFNYERRAIARMVLESYGYTEDRWTDKYAGGEEMVDEK